VSLARGVIAFPSDQERTESGAEFEWVCRKLGPHLQQTSGTLKKEAHAMPHNQEFLILAPMGHPPACPISLGRRGINEGSMVVSTVKDTRAGNLIDSQTTPCACTAETAMFP
jgi:hypothetical protein